MSSAKMAAILFRGDELKGYAAGCVQYCWMRRDARWNHGDLMDAPELSRKGEV